MGLTLTRENMILMMCFMVVLPQQSKIDGKKKRLNNRKDLYKVSAKLPDNKIIVTDAGNIYKTSIRTMTIFVIPLKEDILLK